MIKLFRNVRRNIVTEPPERTFSVRSRGKTSKYFKYAIGEIILVVIGILIALQINNWNERSKTSLEIKKSLQALKNDLIQDTVLISENLREVNHQYQLNELFRQRVAKPNATLDTLINIAKHEFIPNWNDPIFYNTNAYSSLNETGLLEELSDTLKGQIKNFYNCKFHQNSMVEKATNDYRKKLVDYVDSYTFGSTALHDQGALIDSLVWETIDSGHLAASFQGMSNFKRILFKLTKDEMV